MSKTENGTPAANGGIDSKALGEAIASSLATVLPTVLKPFGDVIAQQTTAIAALKPAAATQEESAAPAQQQAKPVTLDDVKKVFTEGMTAFSQQQQQAASRESFIASSLGKLPKAYQAQLGTDPTKWAAEAKTIQTQFEADFKGMGGTPESLGGGANRDGGATADQQSQDFSKRSGFDLLSEAIAEQGATTIKPGDAAVKPVESAAK